MSDLPDEILFKIFSEFEPLRILPFRRVCKWWRYVIDTSTTMQLQIECLLDGRDLPVAGDSWASELQRMRQSNLAWETLTPTKKIIPEVSGVECGHLRVRNGLVALSRKSEAVLEMWEYRGVDVLQSIATHTNIGFQPSLYAFDRAQDVLVLLEDTERGTTRMHIRKLSTNGRHQGAAKETIILNCHRAQKPTRIEIHGDYIAVLIRWRMAEGADNCFFLVDWKEGTMPIDNNHRVWDFCFIDARTVLLAIMVDYRWDCLKTISLKDDVPSVFLDLATLQEDYQHHSLEFRTDGGRLIGLCVGIDMVIQYAGTRDSDSDYLLVIDRPGLLKFLAGASYGRRTETRRVREWAEWASGITRILPLENSSYQMAWAVFGRRIVINAVVETLPFAKSALGVKGEDDTEENGHKDDEGEGSEDSEDPHSGERLVVVDFGSYRLASAVQAGDESGNIIRCRSQESVSLVGVFETCSKGLPCRIWMERVPSCLPHGQVHMSENTVVVCAENSNSIRSIRVF